jgi:hypothetical protein
MFILSYLFFALALATPGTVPASNAAPAGATTATVTNCYCQTIPMKDWGH